MSRIVASLLTVLVVGWLGASPVLSAQATGAVAGRLLDPVGQTLGNVVVELLTAEGGQQIGSALQTGVTDAQGAWAFSGVTPGEYVVQAVLGEAVFGVPVTVGTTLSAGVLIVASSAAAAGVGAAALGLTGPQVGLVATGIGGAVASTAFVVFRNDQS